ncbi:MAG TPA: hypothetical protein VN688_30785 [Gemmataceae bacterium]|nr:hypothetical protein [Gemmataceae bacterium]
MRTLLSIAIVVAAVGLAYFGRVWAEDKEQTRTNPCPRTRIAILNLTYVLKHYDKYKKYEEEIKGIAEESGNQAKEKIAKRSEEQMRICYFDVIEAAQHYAIAHDFDLLLHYNDAITKEDFISTKNIARKLNETALMPVYWRNPSMDISMELVKVLNKRSPPGKQ